MHKTPAERGSFATLGLLAAALLLATPLTGCIVMGTSSRGGFFLWPGGLGAVVLILVLVLLLRRR